MVSQARLLLAPRAPVRVALYNDEFAGMTRRPVSLEELIDTRNRLHADIGSRLTGDIAEFLLSAHGAEPDFALVGARSRQSTCRPVEIGESRHVEADEFSQAPIAAGGTCAESRLIPFVDCPRAGSCSSDPIVPKVTLCRSAGRGGVVDPIAF